MAQSELEQIGEIRPAASHSCLMTYQHDEVNMLSLADPSCLITDAGSS